MSKCPNCGYCKECGRSNFGPYSPYRPPYWYPGYPWYGRPATYPGQVSSPPGTYRNINTSGTNPIQ